MSASDDVTFTTVAAPTVLSRAATDLTPRTARLNATVDTHGFAATVAFTVTSPDSAYGSSTPASVSAVDGPQDISVTLTDLPPGADYVVRVSATVPGLTVFSAPAGFSTPQVPPLVPPAPPPSTVAAPYGCAMPHLERSTHTPRPVPR